MKWLMKKILIRLGVNPKRLWQPHYQALDEVELVEMLLARESDGIMIDVGFAWGNASLPFLMRGWSVFAFEPDRSDSKKSEIEFFQQVFKDSFVVSNEAVSDASGEEVVFYSSAQSEGISSLHRFDQHEPSHTVLTVTLDEIVKRHEIEQIGFLKIDVEGHDLFVLDSLSPAVAEPKVIMVEFDDRKTAPLGYRYSDLAGRLIDRGYDVYVFEWFPIVQYGLRHRFRAVKRAPAKLEDSAAWGNLIAVERRLSSAFEAQVRRSKFSEFYEDEC